MKKVCSLVASIALLSISLYAANPTTVTFEQSAAQFANTTSYDVAVMRGDGVLMTSIHSINRPATQSGNVVTLTLPEGFYSSTSSNGDYSIAVRAVNGGGVSPWSNSPEVAIVFAPIAVTNVQVQ